MNSEDPAGPFKAYECPKCGERWGAFRNGRFRRWCLRCGYRPATSLGKFTPAKLKAMTRRKVPHARTR